MDNQELEKLNATIKHYGETMAEFRKHEGGSYGDELHDDASQLAHEIAGALLSGNFGLYVAMKKSAF